MKTIRIKRKLLLCFFISTFIATLTSCSKDEEILTGSIYGIVNDADNGEPISSANVSLNPGGKTTNTGSDGRYEFPDMEPGLYTIQIAKNGYKTNTKRITVVAGEQTSGDMILQRGESRVKLSTNSLTFGPNETSKVFNILNVGTSGTISWSLSVQDSWLSVNPRSGNTNQGKSSAVIVSIDRTQITQDVSANLIVEADGESLPLEITVKCTESGDSGDSNSGSDIVNNVVIPQGLYVYYKFDGNFEDATENKINGFGTASPTFVEGVTSESKAIKFSKTNNSSFTVSKPIIDSREMTICFWGKDFDNGHIFHLKSSNQNEPMFTLTVDNGSLKFLVTRYSNLHKYDELPSFMHPTITDGKWHHIALVSDFEVTTYSTVTTTLYIDGMEVYTTTEDANHFTENGNSGSSYGTGTSFTMGGSLKLYSTGTLNATNMSVDNFRVYDTRRLSASEIKKIYDARQ